MDQPKQSPLRKWSVILVMFLCLSLDIATKNWARNNLHVEESMPFIPGLLRLTLTSNTGAAFSLGAGNGLLMTALATTMTTGLVIWSVRRQMKGASLIESIGAGCLLGGALGNLFDRFTRGRVTDFLDFAFMTFPVFNLADALIDSGIVLLLISAISQPQTHPKGDERQAKKEAS